MRSAILFIAVALVACQPPGEGGGQAPPSQAPATEAPRPVRLLALAPRAFSERIEVTGTLKAPDDVTVAARGAGTITFLVERGQRVEAGEVIARVDPALPSAGAAQASAQVQVAEAGLRLAEDTLKRQKPLFDQGIVSALEFRRLQAQVDQARAQLRQAQAVAAQARTQVSYTTVEAPFAGVIEERFCERGGQLAPGAPVVRLVSTARLKIEAGVPERYARDVKVGDEAQVSLAAYQLPPRTAAITFVGQAIDPSNRTFSVEFDLDNPDGALKPEMTVRVILSRAARADALGAPDGHPAGCGRGRASSWWRTAWPARSGRGGRQRRRGVRDPLGPRAGDAGGGARPGQPDDGHGHPGR
ncbi:MAG: efflux RND transporter periplasmic adaptor subunit [bacterium]